MLDPGTEAERCFVVLDNSAPDSDPVAGQLTIEDLILGRYTVEETIPPETATTSVTRPAPAPTRSRT